MNTVGFEVEETGGGCQWWRKGNIAITDGECCLPKAGEPCRLFKLDANSNPADGDEGTPFDSLEAALAWVYRLDKGYLKI